MAGKTFPAFPAQPAILRIWQEAHVHSHISVFSNKIEYREAYSQPKIPILHSINKEIETEYLETQHYTRAVKFKGNAFRIYRMYMSGFLRNPRRPKRSTLKLCVVTLLVANMLESMDLPNILCHAVFFCNLNTSRTITHMTKNCVRHRIFMILGVVSRTFRELSKIISRKYTMTVITFMVRISSWNFVRVPKVWLWACEQSFSLKCSYDVRFLQHTNFERIFWRARETLVKQSHDLPDSDHESWRYSLWISVLYCEINIIHSLVKALQARLYTFNSVECQFSRYTTAECGHYCVCRCPGTFLITGF